MPNRREFDHLVSDRFKIEIAGITVGAFTALGGLETSTEVVEFQDGDDLIRRKRPGRTAYANLILRRGYVASSELWDWRRAVIDGHIDRRSGSVIALGDDGSEILRYNFFEAWPCRWKSFAFDAQRPGALFEEIEIVVEKIERG